MNQIEEDEKSVKKTGVGVEKNEKVRPVLSKEFSPFKWVTFIKHLCKKERYCEMKM